MAKKIRAVIPSEMLAMIKVGEILGIGTKDEILKPINKHFVHDMYGEETPFKCCVTGEVLHVGDVVDVYSTELDMYLGETSIAKKIENEEKDFAIIQAVGALDDLETMYEEGSKIRLKLIKRYEDVPVGYKTKTTEYIEDEE